MYTGEVVDRAMEFVRTKAGHPFAQLKKATLDETGDETYHTLFLELNTLHKNFYDAEIPPVDFPIFYRKAISFLKMTEELMKMQIATRITP